MSGIITLAAVAFSSALCTLLLTPLMIRQAHQRGWLDQPDLRKKHAVPTPAIGGIVLGACLLCVMLGFFLLDLWPGKLPLASLPVFDIYGCLSVSLAIVALFALGWTDDHRHLSAGWKIAVQIAIGLVVYLGGLRVQLLEIPFWGILQLGWLSPLVTVGWVVMLTNAVNLIDGMDGLACGVSLPAAIALTVIGDQHGSPASAWLAATVAGFLVVFLIYNRHPARAFLGNSGAYLLGFSFAVISLVLPLKSYTATALFVPLLALGVPVMETLTSVLRRLTHGQPIWRADRQHLFHLLSRAGLSTRATVRIFWLLSAIFSVFSILSFALERGTLVAALILFLVVIWLGFFMFTSQRLGKKGSARVRQPRSRSRTE